MKNLRFGLVGCGRIAKKHAEIISNLDACELVCVCDIQKDRVEKFSNTYSADAYYDYSKMLELAQIDVVSICTPSGLHAKMTIEAAKKGIHIITEKPMAIRLDDADLMIKECKKNNVNLFVVKQNRLNPPVQKLKRALDKGRFGKVFLINTTIRWSRPQEYYDQDAWRGTVSMDGGVLMNQASHHVDLVQWLGGPIKSVFAKKGTFTHDIEVEDTAVVVVEFCSGAFGVIEATTSTYPQNLEGSVSVLGENGSVKVGGFAVNKMEVWKFDDNKGEDDETAKCSTNPPDVYGYGHLEYYKNVINVLSNGAKPFIDGEEGRKGLELIRAIYKSVETKKEIDLPLK